MLAVASQVFAERGFAAATMREIAAGAGLHPSSLYYYFRSKEEMLEAIVIEANRISLDHLAAVEAVGGAAPVAVRLYRIVHFDVRVLCELPYDIGEVLRMAALREARFTQYWQDRRQLHDGVEQLIAVGIADGSLRAVDPCLASLTLLSNDEAVRNWFRRDEIDPGRYDAAGVATFLADHALAGLLTDRRKLDRVRNMALAAEELHATAPTDR